MAPRTASKPEQKRRAADVSGDLCAAKRFKVLQRVPCKEDEATLMGSVVDSLQKAEHVSDTGREMLRCMAAGCLSTKSGVGKHDFQHAVADMLCEVLDGMASDLDRCLQTATVKVEQVQLTRSTSKEDAEKMSQAVVLSEAGVGDARRRFAEDNAALERARGELDAVKDVQAATDLKLSEAKELAAAFQEVEQEHLVAVVEGSSGDLAGHVRSTTALLDCLPVEESLKKAFEGLANVLPGDRSGFHRLILQQVESELHANEKLVSSRLEACAEATAQHSAKVAAAEVAVQEARKQQRLSTADLRLLEFKRWEADGALSTAQMGQRDAEASYASASSEHKAAEVDIDALRRGPRAALGELRQRGHHADVASGTGAAADSVE